MRSFQSPDTSFLLSTETLASVPELAKLGPLFKSSDKPSDLTESETEYVVQCIKHTFGHHIVFQVSSLASSMYVQYIHVLVYYVYLQHCLFVFSVPNCDVCVCVCVGGWVGVNTSGISTILCTLHMYLTH